MRQIIILHNRLKFLFPTGVLVGVFDRDLLAVNNVDAVSGDLRCWLLVSGGVVVEGPRSGSVALRGVVDTRRWNAVVKAFLTRRAAAGRFVDVLVGFVKNFGRIDALSDANHAFQVRTRVCGVHGRFAVCAGVAGVWLGWGRGSRSLLFGWAVRRNVACFSTRKTGALRCGLRSRRTITCEVAREAALEAGTVR